MKAQVLLNTAGAKHLIAKALTKYIDLKKRIYIAYGSTNDYLLYHLGIKTKKLYAAGCNVGGKFNVTTDRDEPIVLENKKLTDIAEFDITANDYFIKGANALWYENSKKCAAVCAADKNGGTYGNFYVKAASRGARVIIPVGHEKLIPFFKETSQNVDFATGSKFAMLRFFYGEVFTEIEAFKILFGLKANVVCAGGIFDSKGAVGFEIDGINVKEAIEFIEKYNNLFLEESKEVNFQF
ncbi:conserved hypothetical protein [Lebetimonas natsushimae]|uniref:Uncharacterized protein n=1 Tax=Lebetimonas natsushimae TaxID=1936991 RepID=A0A292YBH4_9BACT|nr:hypothetical protein [Lebetimonas natsushimae]GAX88312.1 conserved hypothetical protein [Lebetimonas natsushimae]